MTDWLAGFFRKHAPEDAPAVREALERRDALFNDLEGAIQEVDRVQARVIEDYAEAEKRRNVRRRK